MHSNLCAFLQSCPARGTWIEILGFGAGGSSKVRSCPARGTWIEIGKLANAYKTKIVVPRKGHVD